MTVLSWLELPDDDRPNERIWLDDEAISAHFDGVRARYASGPSMEAVPQADEVQNELTAHLRR